MKKLTQKEKDLLLKAAELVDDGTNTFSCNAIDNAINSCGPGDYYSELRIKYATFYGKLSEGSWFEDNEEDEGCISLDRQARVLLLLTFAELG